MIVLRILGILLIVAAIAALGAHVLNDQGYAIADAWASIDRNSLVGLQSLVEKSLDPNPDDPTLYFDVVLPILEFPLWPILAILGFILLVIGTATRKRRRLGR
ncbi:MAG: hypothetical protein CMM50_15690 [Rhodospirillaceae bacterium]|jgi:hypothetical protein|nr:hypothetical protein [Rhodospirillaceae bacterium]|tara:strand:+ start:293 stop:601 length:309 start_codon:yes stop_codon:yes gene_type:complete